VKASASADLDLRELLDHLGLLLAKEYVDLLRGVPADDGSTSEEETS
jgi:hypothetical protein